eukprot:5773458-Pleurochrysis_carterae.AAC.1
MQKGGRNQRFSMRTLHSESYNAPIASPIAQATIRSSTNMDTYVHPYELAALKVRHEFGC